MRALVVLVLLLGLSSVCAFSTRARRSPLTALQSQTKLGSAGTCYYQLNLANYAGDGWQGKQVTVTVGGTAVLTQTLSEMVHEKSVQVPVTAGQSLSLHYSGVSTQSKDLDMQGVNSFWLTDANGVAVLTAETAVDGDYVVPSVASCECVYANSSTCSTTRVRNEFRSLSYCEKKNFIDALTTFHAHPTATHSYAAFTLLHASRSVSVIHRHLFLPWHRAFILEFENALRSQGGRFACVSLPYWDSSLDFGHEQESTVLSELGGYGPAACLNGSFASWTNPSLGTCTLRSTFVGTEFHPSAPCTTATELGISGNNTYKFVYTYLVRNPYRSVPLLVAGNHGTLSSASAPADPVFWLHQANIDRLWAMWQDCWDYDQPGTEARQYEDFSNNMPLEGMMVEHYVNTSSTVSSMFNILPLGYRYPPTYRDLRRLRGSQPVSESATENCKWDWFDSDNFKMTGQSYRPLALSSTQEKLLSDSRASHQTELARSEDYYEAIRVQMKTECDSNPSSYSAAYPDWFVSSPEPLLGPSEYFKNACQLMRDQALEAILN